MPDLIRATLPSTMLCLVPNPFMDQSNEPADRDELDVRLDEPELNPDSSRLAPRSNPVTTPDTQGENELV